MAFDFSWKSIFCITSSLCVIFFPCSFCSCYFCLSYFWSCSSSSSFSTSFSSSILLSHFLGISLIITIMCLAKWWTLLTVLHRSRPLVLWINFVDDIPLCHRHRSSSIIALAFSLPLLPLFFPVVAYNSNFNCYVNCSFCTDHARYCRVTQADCISSVLSPVLVKLCC